jgi:hypothetical protein
LRARFPPGLSLFNCGEEHAKLLPAILKQKWESLMSKAPEASERVIKLAREVAELKERANRLRPTGYRIVSQMDYKAKILEGLLRRMLKAEGISL